MFQKQIKSRRADKKAILRHDSLHAESDWIANETHSAANKNNFINFKLQDCFGNRWKFLGPSLVKVCTRV